jgi:uncharacterized protein (TIGR03083 family)
MLTLNEPTRRDRPERCGPMGDPDPVRCLEEVSVDLVELLRSRVDPDVVALGEWTVSDVAAHLAGLMGIYEGFVRGDVDDADSDVESAASRIARANALGVTGRDAMSFDDIVDEFKGAVRSLIDELRRHDPAEAISLWQARPGRPDVVAGLAVSELLVHGDDIARAARRSWPIPAEAARAAWLQLAWVSPWALDPAKAEGVDASWVVRLRGGGARWFRIHDGTAEVDEWRGQSTDCTILARPSSMLLVTYGRRPRWREIAKGNLLAWGRRPWIAARVPEWFPNA